MQTSGLPGMNWFTNLEMKVALGLTPGKQPADPAASDPASPAVSDPGPTATPPKPNPFQTRLMTVLLQAQAHASSAPKGPVSEPPTARTYAGIAAAKVTQGLDGDSNGTLGQDEVSGDGSAQDFSALDTNGDGQLSAGELSTAIQKVQQRVDANTYAHIKFGHHKAS